MKILEPGVRVLVAHRRLFETDNKRYFAGIIDGYEDGIARVTGYTWVRDGYKGTYERKKDKRTKIVSLSSGTVFVYQLPSALDIELLKMIPQGTSLTLTDSKGFHMNLTESVAHDDRQSAEGRRRA